MFRRVSQKLNKRCVIIACLHLLLSFFTDRLIFQYQLSDVSSLLAMGMNGRNADKAVLLQAGKFLLVIGSKIAFFFVLLVIWHGLFYFVKKADRRFVKYTLLYLALMCVLLLLTYPGIFRMDEFGILFTAQLVFPEFWQNYLTSVFYIFSMMLFPVPAGIVLTQCICISLIVGYLLYKVETCGWVKGKMVYLLYLPFLLFPVLDSNLYPMRMSLYAFVELLLLAEFLFLKLGEEPLTGRKLLRLSLLGALVICWRTEAIYYIVALPVCFLVLFWKQTDKKTKTRFLLLLLACSMGLYLPQKAGDKLRNGNQYALTGMVLPLAPLLSACYEEAENTLDETRRTELTQILDVMDQVVNVELIVEGYGNGRTGISMFWSEADFQRSYTDRQFSDFKKAYYNLICRYPKVFLQERVETFVQSEDLLENTTEIYDTTDVPNHERFRNMFGNKPLNKQLRSNVISTLEMRQWEDYDAKLPGYHLVYHVTIPLCLLLFVLVGLCIKRKWEFALLLASHLCKVPLIFLTAPSRLFMYYYPVYLAGFVTAWTLFLIWISRKGAGNE